MKWKLVFFFSQSRNVMREFIFIMKKLILVEEEDTLHVTLCRLRIHVTLSTATKQTHEIQG